jgi:hypothetical protein
MRCSDQDSKPFPPTRSSVPTIAADRHWIRVGKGSRARVLQVRRINPEMRNRIPALMNGGIVTTTNMIAR